jgi:hypothetical protein
MFSALDCTVSSKIDAIQLVALAPPRSQTVINPSKSDFLGDTGAVRPADDSSCWDAVSVLYDVRHASLFRNYSPLPAKFSR